MVAIITRGLLGIALIVMMLAPVAAQSQPTKARIVKIIVPLTPGTGPDIIARMLGPKLSEKWKVPVIVENRPGASGIIGTDAVAKAQPDGYTLLLTPNNFVTNASLRRNLPYDTVRDFAPVMLLGRAIYTLIANPAFAANTVGELVSLAKASPGKINYGSSGAGSSPHLAMELFKAATGTNLTHVPYKGMSGLTTDLVSGEVSVAFVPTPAALPLVAGKRLKLLAAGSTQRSAFTPGVPSFRESGVSNFDVDVWIALLVPASTPQEMIATLNGDIGGLLKLPDVREALAKQGITPTGGTPAELAELIKRDMERWGKVKLDASALQD
jgi:tripartite-type tricarboxylate transporter receptor subunit TctC